MASFWKGRGGGLASIVIATALWGAVYPLSKWTVLYLPPWTVTLWRELVAIAFLGPVMAFGRQWRIARRDWGWLALAALLGHVISYGTLFGGSVLTDSTHTSLLAALSPLVMVILNWLVFREPLLPLQWTALAVGTAGLLLVVGPLNTALSPRVVWGDLLVAAYSVAYAGYSVVARLLTQRYPSLAVTAWSTVLGGGMVAPLALVSDGARALQPAALTWPALAYLGIAAGGVGAALWVKGINQVDGGTSSVLYFIQVPIGVLGGWLFLGEHLGPLTLVGGALIVAAGVLSSIRGRQPAAATSLPASANKTAVAYGGKGG